MGVEFPKMSLERAVSLPDALQQNGGQPLTAIDLATAINVSPGSSTIRVINAASSAYGLTSGSYKSLFKMEALGQAITAPKTEHEKAASLVTAALRPPAFAAVFEYYRGKKFPDKQFFINTVIREFDVEPKQAEQFYEIFSANVRFVGLVRSTPGGDWLVQQPLGLAQSPQPNSDVVQPDIDGEIAEDSGGGRDLDSTAGTPPESLRRKRPNKLFVGHGRNKKPMEQLTKVLRDLGIPYMVAEDEPNAGRPISDKVRQTMEQCGAAVLVFTADVEYSDKDGNAVWRPSENVTHELGAASIMYDNRIIMFKEDSIDLASNFSSIGYIPFEKDKLDSKTNELLRELVALKILRLSVGDDE
jgi:predicted nucleotide-binding protein